MEEVRMHARRRITCAALMLSAVVSSHAFAQVPKLPSEVTLSERIDDGKDILQTATQDTLVVFDIDDTLLTSESFFGSDYWYEWQKGLKPDDPGFVPCKFDIIAMNYELGSQRPVEPQEVDMVRQVTVDRMYLTSRNPAYRPATERELQRNGYPFPPAISQDADGVIFALTEGARTVPVSYFNGIYMVSGQGKGPALIELLRRAGKSYAKVILVDDGRKNIDSMKTAMETAGVAYHGFHYLRVGKSLPLQRELLEQANGEWQALQAYLKVHSPARAAQIEAGRLDPKKCFY
jgi:hypothetical protein